MRRSRTGATIALTLAVLGLCVPAGAAAVPGSAPGGVAAAAPAAPGAASPAGRYVVRGHPLRPDPGLPAAVAGLGGRVVAVQRSLGTVVVELPAGAADRLAARPGVRAVAPDRAVKATALGFSPSTVAGAMTNVTRLTGANKLWQAGITGKGVDVALIDSGVAPVPALSRATKVVVGPDLSFESQDGDLRFLDTYGHGTHMAGIIAGRETAGASGSTYAADTTNYYGMAPDARIVSLKLADRNGAVDVSQVIAAVDWVVQHRTSDGMNIRVLNLSYGTESPQDWTVDPLSWAAEVAWHEGITVVVSAGNDGDARAGLANPAYNPWLIAVGATDTRGTDTLTDDTVPSFSARSLGSTGDRQLDVVAPGLGIVGPTVPGSAIHDAYPGARLGNGFIRGNGTSQAAAVVSGGVALLLQHRPWLTPDDVKHVLRSSTTWLASEGVAGQGAGAMNLARARYAAPSGAPQELPWGDGAGSLETARAGLHLTADGVDLTGEQDIFGNEWDSPWLSHQAQWSSAWWEGHFNGTEWLGTGFAPDTVSWAGKTWSGKTWSGKTWSGQTWSGKTWSGKTWSSSVWTGTAWRSASWPSPVGTSGWTSRIWSSAGWKSAGWS